ncbi:BRI1 kinase inhibitor 1-like [Diospyros lotus]|uniref:BRI1 kinase inhibitor 1-like n=1 Tax=Diospyros lotus TaxID=55363 RepID=UPI0022576591|nr:BRI1 kinase inhibitor 1-like [Diospyros lotus]
MMMDSQQNQKKMRDKAEGEDDHHQNKLKQSSSEATGGGQLLQLPPAAASPPPSASSSPAHEFSFTISLHHQHYQSSSTTTTTATSAGNYKTKAPPAPPSIAVDLSPADEIFFHGHLLPLHLLSHYSHPTDLSPRFSTNSVDSFTNIGDLLEDPNPNQTKTKSCSNIKAQNHPENNNKRQSRPKSKSFSLFGLSRWRKGGFEIGEKEKQQQQQQKSKKLKFDVSHVIKRYIRMVRPLLTSFRSRRRTNLQLRRQPYSFSGNLLSPRSGKRSEFMMRGRPGEYSAPASMRTSPTNSGLLVATPATTNSSSSDSTMEELQAAIQAAIAHCKNSIAMDHQDNQLVKCVKG